MSGIQPPRSQAVTDVDRDARDWPFIFETALERALAADAEWRAGTEWGEPRGGHPEGAVKWHIAEVLANLDRLDLPPHDRSRLRIAALVHDTFKARVDRSAPRMPPNEHGFQAARWLAARVTDPELEALVELHDEGFRAWSAHLAGREDEAQSRVTNVRRRLGDGIALFVTFYWADNRSGDKDPRQLDWFVEQLTLAGGDDPREHLSGGASD